MREDRVWRMNLFDSLGESGRGERDLGVELAGDGGSMWTANN